MAAASGMWETLENKGSDEWSLDHAAPLRIIPVFFFKKTDFCDLVRSLFPILDSAMLPRVPVFQ